MPNDRREFMTMAGATAAGIALAAPAMAQTPAPGQFRAVKALAFDAYGTLFDVFSVTALCEQLFPGKGTQLAQTWRVKQLQYSLMRSLMGRHRDFWGLTEDGHGQAGPPHRAREISSLSLRDSAATERHRSAGRMPPVLDRMPWIDVCGRSNRWPIW